MFISQIIMKYILYIFLVVFLALTACKKPAGTGGSSSIKGNIWVQDYNKDLTAVQYQYAGVDVEVYIIYGNDLAHGDKVNTNANGEFEFKYLRKGNYKIYAISQERIGTTNDSKEVAVSVDASVTKNKQMIDVGQIIIKQ